MTLHRDSDILGIQQALVVLVVAKNNYNNISKLLLEGIIPVGHFFY